MANISKRRLKKEAADKVHKQFLQTIVNLKNKSGANVLEELFTQTEQVLFAKRLAAIFMLAQKITPFHVSRVLNLSPATTARLQRELLAGQYSHIKDIVRKKKDRDQFWAELEVLVRLGMPEMGKNRWKWLNDI